MAMADRTIKNILMSSADRRAICRMAAVCNRYGAAFFERVPVGDVLDVEALTGTEPVETAAAGQPLVYDCVVCRTNGRPILALDVCTRSARRVAKNRRAEDACRRKDELARLAGLTYIRVHSPYIVGRAQRLSLLSWCTEQWFLHQDTEEGSAPEVDLFAPGSGLLAWPSNLFDDLKARLDRLHSGLSIPSCRLEYELGHGKGGIAMGLGTMVLDEAWGFSARCEISTQNAAGREEDLLRVILVKHLLHQYRRFELGGKCKKRKGILRKRRKFRRRCRVESTGSFGWGF